MIQKTINMYKFLRKVRKNLIYSFLKSESFGTFTICTAPQKFTAKLLPEIEAKLEADEIKHRKHPGVRKFETVLLPEWLLNATSNFFSHTHDHEEKIVMNTAIKLQEYLYHRRLPIEQDEINKRTLYTLEKMNVDIEELNYDDKQTKKYLDYVKNKLKCELLRWKPIEYNHHVSQAYLIVRLAANYACTAHVFQEILTQIPTFKPTSCFDFGSGVGSATWAANTYFKNSIKEYFCVDASAEMNTITDRLLKGGKSDEDEPLIKQVYFRQFLPASSKRKYDLVVSAFSLMELSSLSDRIKVIDTLWQKTNDMLVIIENGGKAGFSIILEARDYILKIENESEYEDVTGAHVLAPCPHEMECPLFIDVKDAKQMPCQFSVEYFSPYPKKDANVKKKDIYTYVVLRRGKRNNDVTAWPRIVKPVLKGSRKAYCRLCCNNGSLHELILTKKRHGRHLYRCARSSSRGDLLPASVVPIVKAEDNDNEEDLKDFKDDDEDVNDEESIYCNK